MDSDGDVTYSWVSNFDDNAVYGKYIRVANIQDIATNLTSEFVRHIFEEHQYDLTVHLPEPVAESIILHNIVIGDALLLKENCEFSESIQTVPGWLDKFRTNDQPLYAVTYPDVDRANYLGVYSDADDTVCKIPVSWLKPNTHLKGALEQPDNTEILNNLNKLNTIQLNKTLATSLRVREGSLFRVHAIEVTKQKVTLFNGFREMSVSLSSLKQSIDESIDQSTGTVEQS